MEAMAGVRSRNKFHGLLCTSKSTRHLSDGACKTEKNYALVVLTLPVVLMICLENNLCHFEIQINFNKLYLVFQDVPYLLVDTAVWYSISARLHIVMATII